MSEELNAPLDPVSPIVRDLLKRGAASEYRSLVVERAGSRESYEVLSKLTPQTMLAKAGADDSDGTRGMLCALWLWHDHLGEAHEICQDMPSATGAFWHAIMHRREGDFSNSKYWFARCEDHAVYPTLAVRSNDLTHSYPADNSVFRLNAHGWDPRAYVDLVQQVCNKPNDPRYNLAVAVQQIEWQTLFDHCTRAAVG